MRILGSAISLSSIATTSLPHVSRWVDGRIWNIENVGMTVEPKILNPKQIQVMEWIRNGCPEGVYDSGYEHRISAGVLERRGLEKQRSEGLQEEASTSWHHRKNDAPRKPLWSVYVR